MFGRRYWIEYSVWTSIFLASIFLAQAAAGHLPAGSSLRLAVILLPLAAVIGGFWVELRNLRRIDEMQRQIYLTSLFYGLGSLALFCTAAALLERWADWPRVSPMWAVVANGVGCLFGWLISWRRYQ